MRIACILIALICISIFSFSQKFSIVPRVGMHYYGASYIKKGDYKPEDFRLSTPEKAVTIGVDLRYKSKSFIHVLSIQSIALGTSWGFYNIYMDYGIIPSASGYREASAADQTLISYGLEKETNNKGKIRGSYGFQISFGFNKDKEYYDSIFIPDGRREIFGTNYIEHKMHYTRGNKGVFFTAKGGISLYNKQNRAVLNLQAFFHKGFTKMITYDLEYRYGYLDYPQYQKSDKVKFHSKGTVFGVTLGVPIYLLKD